MPLFDEPDDARQAVADDLSDGFRDIFEERDPLVAVGLFSQEAVGSVSASLSVVAWEWRVAHVGAIQGTPPTGKEVTMRGVTIIENEEEVVGRGGTIVPGGVGPRVFSRYIDWLALYAELGAVTIARPPVDDRTGIPDNVNHPVDPDA